MITYKLPIQNQIDITNYLNQYNNVLRFAYNRFQDNLSFNTTDVIRLVKSTMNNIESTDAFIIQMAVNEAYGMRRKKKVIFGGKLNFFKRKADKITKEEYQEKRNSPIMLQGSIINIF